MSLAFGVKSTPIQYTNVEDIMHSTAADYVNYNIEPGIGKIDSTLYDMYAPEDFRKSLFFRSDNGDGYYFTGNYDGGASWIAYNGLATDEIYLIKAECEARLGLLAEAMSTINTLLVNRYKQGIFKPYTPSTAQEALLYILNERRKELVYRMLRFTDIKRLNVQGANISLKRIVDGVVHELPANDAKFALPIPDNIIQTTGMEQN